MEKEKRDFDYFSRTLAFVNQMKSNGENVSHLQVKKKFFKS